ncbi:MAG: TPM domain-containing protein [Crocinitomicaceae bacterium]
MTKRIPFLLVLILICFPFFLQGQIQPKNIPNKKVTDNQNFYDGSGRLKEMERDSLNNLLSRIETQLGYPISVVLLNSIDEQNTHQFALDLFNLWGVGDSKTNNGLLIMVVLEARRTEFITGTGVEGILPDALCYKIQQKSMNPYFKDGNFYLGLYNGIKTVEYIYLGNPVEYLNETVQVQAQAEEGPKTREEMVALGGFSKFSVFLVYELPWYYLLVMAGTVAFCLFLMLIALMVKDLMLKYNLIKFSSLGIFRIFFPFPFLLFRSIISRFMDSYRYKTRYSPTTGSELFLLNENEEDKFLDKLHEAKEKVGSYDYDVWISEGGAEFVIIPYKTWFKFVRKCPSCKQRTMEYKGSTVTRSATYSSSGAGYKTYVCQNCKHKKIKHYTIPRLSPPSSGSSSYSSSSSSSWSSSSSSSSSSGGSWGGGSSSGGGAGSSW